MKRYEFYENLSNAFAITTLLLMATFFCCIGYSWVFYYTKTNSVIVSAILTGISFIACLYCRGEYIAEKEAYYKRHKIHR